MASPTRRQSIGLPLATMLVTSNIVGSGIFLLPAALAAFGGMTVIAWLLATAGAVLVSLVLGKLARHDPEAGGPCAYAAIALGPYLGFQTTAVYWVSCWVGNVAIAVAAVGYAGHFFPALQRPHPAALAAIALIWAMTLLNRLGPRLVCQFESATLLLGLVPILLVAIGGWFYFHRAVFLASWNVSGGPVWKSLPEAVVLAFWAFLGLESAAIATAVVERPERNVARATFYGVLLSALIYLPACGVMMGLMPASRLARSTAPFADAAGLVLGSAVGGLVALLALVKVTGTLGGWILISAETGKAGAERGLFPVLFARLDRRGQPSANLFLLAAIMSAAVWLSMSPTLGQQFAKLIEASTVLTLLLYLYACLAVDYYQRTSPAEFRGYRGLAAVTAVVCAAVMAGAGESALAAAATVVALTVPAYWLLRQRRWRLNRTQ